MPNREMIYPYNFQWNFGIEHQLTNTMVLKTGYVGTRTFHLVSGANMNPPVPVKQFDPTLGSERWFTPENAKKPNPNFAATRTIHNLGNAWYHALQLQLEQRYNSGLTYNVSYTFSKNEDTTGPGLKGAETNAAGGRFFVYNIYDLGHEKGLSNLHAAHNFTLSFGYALPFGTGKRIGSNWNGFLKQLAGGWQVNGIFTSRTGQPVTILNNFDRARNGATLFIDRPDLAPGKSNNPVLENWTPDKYFDPTVFLLQPAGYFGNVGRNTLINPGVTNTTLSFFKEFAVGEAQKLQFRAEFFNIPNHPNFANPGNTIYSSAAGTISSSAGVITSMRTAPRQVQFGLKFEF